MALIRGPGKGPAWQGFRMAHHLEQGPLGADEASLAQEGKGQDRH